MTTTIETRSEQAKVAMAQVNLAHAFVVSGAQTYPGRTQIVYSTTLGADT